MSNREGYGERLHEKRKPGRANYVMKYGGERRAC